MEGYSNSPDEIRLSQLHEQSFVKLAEEHGSATWSSIRAHFDALHLQVSLRRDRERGDDEIRIHYDKDPSEPADVTRMLRAVQGQFVPLNRSEAIERALGPEMSEFYRLREEGLSRLETLTAKLIGETHNYRTRLDAEVAEQKQALTTAFEEGCGSFS